jgi:predicted transcriptional regulator
VRTTIDLPDDLHRQALSIARETSRSLSEIVVELMRRGLEADNSARISRSASTGLPVIAFGKVVTSDDVASLVDDQ